jgi:multidrug efflux pump subunit AcrB
LTRKGRAGSSPAIGTINFSIPFALIYLNTRSLTKTFIVLLTVPFSLIGAFWLVYLLGYNMSVAVWIGLIALAGLDAETGVVMLLYLDLSWAKFLAEGRMNSLSDLYLSVREGAVQRIRPKMMAVCAILFGVASDHVGARLPSRGRYNEANRCAHDRRSHYFGHLESFDLSGHLRHVA